MKNIFENQFCLLAAAVVMLLGFSGCTTNYDVLEPIPEYPELTRQYNTAATVEYVPYSDAALNKIIRENLKINNYKDIISGVHYKGDRKNPVRIIVPLELRNQVFKCANGNFLETRVILMVRQPGEIHNGALVYPAPRYFQAFSQLRLLESAAQASEINAGIVQCVENLFRIEEFRSALEPDSSR